MDRFFEKHGPLISTSLLCSLCAIFYGLGSPKLNWYFLGPVVLVPLLAALDNKTPRQGFFTGWLCGTLIHLVCFTWVIGTIQRYSNLNLSLSVMAWILFSVYSGLAFGAMTSLYCFLSRSFPLPGVVTFPLCYTAMEFLFPFIFPWHVGAGLYGVLPLIQISDLFGIYGCTALVAAVNVPVWELLRFFRKQQPFPVFSLAFALILLILTLGYGFHKIQTVDRYRAQAERYPVGVVQANVQIEERRTPLLQSDIWGRYRRLSREVVRKGARLIVWPESAVHFAYHPGASSYSMSGILRKLVQSFDRPLLFGSWSSGPEGPRNTAYLLDPTGKQVDRYDKVHLLAFGEYLPFSNLFPQVKGWIQGVGDFQPGRNVEPLCWEGTCFGVLICYEAILDRISRQFVNRGAKFLVNITNDVWFGDTNCPEQHLMLASFRAVENRVWLVRDANTGISAFVDPVGRILNRTPLLRQDARVCSIELMELPSLYKAWGDWFPISCSILAGFLLVFGLVKNKRNRS